MRGQFGMRNPRDVRLGSASPSATHCTRGCDVEVSLGWDRVDEAKAPGERVACGGDGVRPDGSLPALEVGCGRSVAGVFGFGSRRGIQSWSLGAGESDQGFGRDALRRAGACPETVPIRCQFQLGIALCSGDRVEAATPASVWSTLRLRQDLLSVGSMPMVQLPFCRLGARLHEPADPSLRCGIFAYRGAYRVKPLCGCSAPLRVRRCGTTRLGFADARVGGIRRQAEVVGPA